MEILDLILGKVRVKLISGDEPSPITTKWPKAISQGLKQETPHSRDLASKVKNPELLRGVSPVD